MAALGDAAPALRTVIAVVAALAKGGEVLIGAVLRLVVEMGDGQHHFAAGVRVRLAVGSAAPLAAVAFPRANPLGDLRPVGGISGEVLRPDRHHCRSRQKLGSIGWLNSASQAALTIARRAAAARASSSRRRQCASR